MPAPSENFLSEPLHEGAHAIREALHALLVRAAAFALRAIVFSVDRNRADATGMMDTACHANLQC